MGRIRTWKKFVLLASMFVGLLFVWNMDVSADFMGTVTLKEGDNRQFESQGGFLPSTKKYHWWVSDASIISVGPDEGNPNNSKYARVTALKPGTATLYVKHAASGGNVFDGIYVYEQTDRWTITVEEKENKNGPTEIKLNHVYRELAPGEGCQLTYTLVPAGSYASVSFTSSNPTVASVGEKSGYITAKSAGLAKITARASNGIEETCWVKVASLNVSGIQLDKKSLTLEKGKSKKLTAILSPAGATGTITWKSSNPKIVSVKNGTVKGIKSGKATITARVSSEIYAKCKVTVPKTPKSVTINKKKLSLTINEKSKLSYKLSPSGAKSNVKWSSNKPKVASVQQDGTVTALKKGTATITVKTSNGKKASCKVTVKAPLPSSVSLNKTKVTLEKGKTLVLKCSVTPSYAEKKITWSTSNRAVADVSSSGKVTVKGAGTAVITARTSNGKRATCKITVESLPSSIRLSETSLDLMRGDSARISYTLSPVGAVDKVSWSSSDSSIVSVDQTGNITAKNLGTATITVKCPNGPSASCKVTVKAVYVTELNIYDENIFLKKGNTQAIEYTALPENHTEILKWTSSNPEVATVDQNGKVTGKAVGTTTITAAVGDFRDSCNLTVTESECVDISKSNVSIWNKSYRKDGVSYPYDPGQGIIVFQSCKDRTSNTLDIWTDPDGGEDIHVTLAGINIDSYGMSVHGQAKDVDVYISLMEGTDNFVSSSHCEAFYCSANGNSNVYIDGKGSLELQNTNTDSNYRSDCAIRVAWGSLVICSGNIKAKTTSTGAGVIYLERSYSSLTILPEAKVVAIGGTKLLDTYEGAEADIAPGSLTYQQK